MLFRELKTQYELDEFDTSKKHVVEILLYAALLSLLVSRDLLDLVTEQAIDEIVFPTERWATTFRSYAQRVLSVIVVAYSYEPNPSDTWYQEARQPSPSRRTLLEEVNAALYAGFTS